MAVEQGRLRFVVAGCTKVYARSTALNKYMVTPSLSGTASSEQRRNYLRKNTKVNEKGFEAAHSEGVTIYLFDPLSCCPLNRTTDRELITSLLLDMSVKPSYDRHGVFQRAGVQAPR